MPEICFFPGHLRPKILPKGSYGDSPSAGKFQTLYH